MVGERLKSIRKKKGLSQKELAALHDTSQGYVCDIELGKKLPGSDFLLSLKRFLDVDLNWFLTGEQPGMAAESTPIWLAKIGPADKLKLKLVNIIARIVDENDEMKIKVVESQLDLLDPGEKRSKKAENG